MVTTMFTYILKGMHVDHVKHYGVRDDRINNMNFHPKEKLLTPHMLIAGARRRRPHREDLIKSLSKDIRDFESFVRSNYRLDESDHIELSKLTPIVARNLTLMTPEVRSKLGRITAHMTVSTPSQVLSARKENQLDTFLYPVPYGEVRVRPVWSHEILSMTTSQGFYMDMDTHKVLPDAHTLPLMKILRHWGRTSSNTKDEDILGTFPASERAILAAQASLLGYPSVQVAIRQIVPNVPVFIRGLAEWQGLFKNLEDVWNLRPAIVQW